MHRTPTLNILLSSIHRNAQRMLKKTRGRSSRSRSLKSSQSPNSRKKRLRHRLLYEALEERRVLDAEPVITVDSLITNDATPRLTGTVDDATATIEITVGSETLSATNQGTTWELQDNALTAALSEGTYDVVASATNSFGTGTDATTNELTIDLTAPSAPASLDLADASDTGASSNDEITSDATPLISGISEAGSGVELFDTDGVTSLGATTASGDGSWSILSAGLSDGAHGLTAVATDAAGNTSLSSAALNITVDTVAPTVEVNIQFVSDSTPEIQGTVSENDAGLEITVAGQTIAATNNANGTWTLADNASTSIVDGTYNVWATATDLAGNLGTDTNVDELTIDTVAPATPSTPDLVWSSDTGISTTDDFTADSTPTLAGSADPGSVVEIFDDATSLGLVTTDVGGAWLFTAPSLGDGIHTLTAVATDPSGNVSAASPSLTITVDTAAALVTVDSLVTNDSSPELTGTVDENSAVVRVKVAGQSYTATNNTDGTWTLADDVLAGIADGTYDVSVTATDAAENVGADTTASELEIDTMAPIVSVDELVTNDTTPELTGSVDDAIAVVSVTVAGQTHSATNNGDGTWTLASGVLSVVAEGIYDVSVAASDVVGNVGVDGTSDELLVDTTTPVAPSGIDLVASSDTGISNTDNITADNTPVIVGFAEPNSEVYVYSSGSFINQTQANASGAWGIQGALRYSQKFDFGTSVSPVAEGYTQVTVSNIYFDAGATYGWEYNYPGAVDRAVGDDAVRDLHYVSSGVFHVDLPNGDYQVTVTLGDSGSIIAQSSRLSFEDVVVGNFSHPAGEQMTEMFSVAVVDGELTMEYESTGAGKVSIAEMRIARSGEFDEGAQTITVVAIDQAGNVSDASSELALDIDTSVPELGLDSLETTDQTPGFSGTVDEATSGIWVSVAGQYQPATDMGDGSWELPDDSFFSNPRRKL
jgi:hypothetical protein